MPTEHCGSLFVLRCLPHLCQGCGPWPREHVASTPFTAQGVVTTPLLLQVENWNPLTDTVPIHSWIHPWLPLMQARLEPLYSPIRSKLSSALQKWHPSDS